MKRDKKYSIITFICSMIFFIIIVGGIQLYWWDLWDENIKQDLISENEKCNNIFLKNIKDTKKDFINYERAGEDNNVFDIDSKCYKLRNDFNFVYNYELKESHFVRLFSWLAPLIVSIFLSFIVYTSTDERY